jgi:hypothetical protein
MIPILPMQGPNSERLSNLLEFMQPESSKVRIQSQFGPRTKALFTDHAISTVVYETSHRN